MQLAARGLRLARCSVRRLGLRSARAARLRNEPPAGVRWVHGGRQLMRDLLDGRMKRPAVVLATFVLFAVGCPPPAYLEVFNNGPEPIVVVGGKGEHEIAPASSTKLRFEEAVHEWREAPDQPRFPVLLIRAGDQTWEYERFQVFTEPWVLRYGSIATWSIQIEGDGKLLVIQTDAARPLPSGAPQPEGFPVQPRPKEA